MNMRCEINQWAVPRSHKYRGVVSFRMFWFVLDSPARSSPVQLTSERNLETVATWRLLKWCASSSSAKVCVFR
jgi:hypothetical protein